MQDVNAVQYSLIKSKLSKGWSYPLQRSVLDDALFSVPGIQVRTVHYAHHIHKFKYDGVKVLSIRYSGILDALAPGGYSISLWSVPSKFKNEISLQIAENVLPEILDWIRALEVASMTTREREHELEYIYSGNAVLRVTEEMQKAKPKIRRGSSKQYFTGK